MRRTTEVGVTSSTAPRDTFEGVGFGRKAGFEARETIRWGHFFSPSPLVVARRLGVGQGHPHPGARTLFARDFELAAMRGDNAMSDRQAEA
jgi:hypothetical protein